MRENEHLKEKLAQIEASSQICFHGKNLPPPQDKGSNPCAVPSCQNSVRTAVEQSHATFQHQQYQIKSVVSIFCQFLTHNI